MLSDVTVTECDGGEEKNPTETHSESCKVEKTSTSNHKCDWLEAESLETWSVPSLEQRAADAHNPLTVAAVHSQSLFPLFLLLFPSFFHPSHQHRKNHCILPFSVPCFCCGFCSANCHICSIQCIRVFDSLITSEQQRRFCVPSRRCACLFFSHGVYF